MAILSDKDLAMLSALMYCQRVVEYENNKPLSKIVDDLLGKLPAELWGKNGKNLYGDYGNIHDWVKEEVDAVVEKAVKEETEALTKELAERAIKELPARIAEQAIKSAANKIAKEAVRKAAASLAAEETGVKISEEVIEIIAEQLWKGAVKDAGEQAGIFVAVEEFRKLLREMQTRTDTLMKLTLVEPFKKDGTKWEITAACFAEFDNDGNIIDATVAFRGTDSSYRAWWDNFEGGGTTIATPMQEAAKAYIDKLAGLGIGNITVTGHSKGGNLAAFVTVLCSNVSNCVSFDGQGFSQAFHDKYKDLIAA